MALDVHTVVEGGRTRGARHHSRADIARIQQQTGQFHAGFIELDLYTLIPVFGKSSKPADLEALLERANR